MSYRFDRVYRLVVGQPGQGNAVEITNLRISFEISKTTKKHPNNSKIQIWNLSKATREKLEKPGTRCDLYAGYAEEDGPLLVFSGDVTFAWTRFDGPDVITQLELGDGAAAYRDTVVSLGYSKAVNSRTVLQDLAKQMGLPLNLPSDAPSRVWQHGLSFHGSARSALDKVTRGTGLEWSIQNGSLQVIRAGGTTARQVVVLAADTGLVDTPERQRSGPEEAVTVEGATPTPGRRRVASATTAWDGWRVKSLLLPTLLPGDKVKMESRTVQGVFRIRELRHSGDSHEGDWITELALQDPSAPMPQEDNKRG